MTLAELRDKVNARLTPLVVSIDKFQTRYFEKNGTYKSIPIRKLAIEASNKFDVWGRVLADSTGYSIQVLVEVAGTQYARSRGYGTGTTFDWKVVSVGQLKTEPQGGPPCSIKVEDLGPNGARYITF